MQRRFTIIQGGLSEGRQAHGSEAGAWSADRVGGWRIALRRPGALDGNEIAQWRALAERAAPHDPFADPDFLAVAGRHAPGAGLVFALAFARSGSGAERLCGVLPLDRPHPVWGGSTMRLWHPGLAPRPVVPVFDAGLAADAMEAVMRHLDARRPLPSLRLSRIAAEGVFLRALRADARLRVATRPGATAIPEGLFVGIGGRDTPSEMVRVESAEGMRDAVERFLLLDARRSRRPLLSDPAAAATLRVVTRLMARRGLAEVELGSTAGEIASGAIRLGRPGERVAWRSVHSVERDAPAPATVDVDLALSGQARGSDGGARLRLVASRA